jgi:hypothetical protein
MGMMKKLSVLDIGDKVAIKNTENDRVDYYVGKVEDILDYWDEDVYHVRYMDDLGKECTTSITVDDIDLVKQKELYYGN